MHIAVSRDGWKAVDQWSIKERTQPNSRIEHTKTHTVVIGGVWRGASLKTLDGFDKAKSRSIVAYQDELDSLRDNLSRGEFI